VPPIRDYQKKCIKKIKSKDYFALFLKPGLGKTRIVLEAYKDLKKKGEVDQLLVVAKLRIAISTWPKEIKKWGLLDKGIRYGILYGKNREEIWNDPENDILITNYESLPWILKEYNAPHPRKISMVAIDESSKIKNTKTKRFKILKTLRRRFDKKVIMTGTPCPNKLKDIFGQIYFLDGGLSLGKYITHFLTTYFYPSGYMGYDWKPYEDSEKKITKKIKSFVASYGDEMIDGMPERMDVTRTVELSSDIMENYRELEKEFVLQLEEDEVVAISSVGLMSKLRQYVGGCIYGENKKRINIHEEKVEEVREIIEELQGSPVLIAFEFNHEMELLKENFPNAVFYSNKTKPKEGVKIEDRWNRGEIEVLFGQSEIIAHGLNLQEGSGRTVVWYTIPLNLETYEQLNRRVWRNGQKSKFVDILHIVARGTTDEVIMKILQKKDAEQSDFLEMFKKHYGVSK